MYNPRLKSKESLVDMSTYGTDSRKRMHSTVLIGDHCEYHPMFKEGDILDANATLNLIQDIYDENKIFETFSEEGRQIAERLDRIESVSDENNTQIVNEITEIDNKFSTQTENIRNDINSILQLIPELKRVVDINLVSDNGGKKTYLVEKQNGELSYIEITDGEKGDPFVYNDFTREQLESLKVKGDKGDKGDRGISVTEVKQTKLSYVDKGENIWRMTLNDGTISEFVVRNGSGAEYVGALEQGISTESTRARDAEAALQLNINLLALQQQQDVQRLSTEIDTKISDVIGTAPAALDTLGEIATKLAYNDDAVTSIVSAISTETTNRQQSESILLNNIDAVSTALNNLDQTLTSRIGTEESRALLAERLISSDLVTLSGIVNTNNTDLSSGLSTEQSRAEAAETALNLAITQEVSDRQAAISEETTRALTVEASLQSDITVEYQRASTAENTLDGKIDLEISDRQSAISTLSATVTANKTSVDNSISDLSNNKADKATTIAGYGITNAYTKTEVDSLIQTEENRATAAEQAVAGDLSDEITRATTAEQTNATAISANEAALQSEIARATAAEQANAAAIQANATAIAAQINKSEMGSANGVATLDAAGKVPSSLLPSYVDDVIEGYYNDGNFYTTLTPGQDDEPDTYSGLITAESDKIYVDKSTNLTYRWSGSVYVTISSPQIYTAGDGLDLSNGEFSVDNTVVRNSKTAAQGGTDLSLVSTGEKYTWNSKANAETTISGYGITDAKIENGTITLGSNTITPLTSHQDITGKADKSATVSTVSYDTTNKKITKTINGVTTDIVTAEKLFQDSDATKYARKTDFDLSVLKQAVADGNLEKYGLKVGDQKTINGRTYVIAELNTMKGTATPYRVNKNHVGLIVIPHTKQAWNASRNTYTGANSRGAGYKNSDLHYYLKNTLLPLVRTDLGSDNLISHYKMLSSSVDPNGPNKFGGVAAGCSNNWAWEENCYISALSEVQVYGAAICSSSLYDTGEACRQLEVFQKYSHTEIFGGEYPWLRDVASATYAALANDGGLANYNIASSAFYVAALILFN